MDKDIKNRTFEVALKIINISELLPSSNAGSIIARQLIRSGTSIGANVEEATAASSKEDFAHRMNIALREAREAHYWLRIIQAMNSVTLSVLNTVLQESEALKRILGAIVSTSRGTRKK